MGDMHIRDIPDGLRERMKLAAAIKHLTGKEFVIAALTTASDTIINEFQRADPKLRPESAVYDAKTEVMPKKRRSP